MRVKCPNCMNSSNVIDGKCENCNFDIYEYIKNNKMCNDYNYNIDKYVFICPHCGTIDAGQGTIRMKCYICGTPYKVADMLRSDYWEGVYVGEKERELINKYVGDTINWNAYNKREDNSNDAMTKAKQKQQSVQKNIPKCPTCGSTNIRKIPTTKKAMGAIGLGLFSKTARSQFECLDCRYKW